MNNPEASMMTTPVPAHPDLVVMDASDRRWGDFIKSNLNATIFHHPTWIRLLEDCYRYRPFIVAVCDEAGNIRAGIPIMEVKSRLTGHRWVSLPFSDYCNPLFDDSAWLNALQEGLLQLVSSKAVPRVEVRWDLLPNRSIPAVSRYVLHNLELDPEIQTVLNRAHRTQRQNIRRAEKEGVQIEWGRGLDAMRVFYRHQCLTRQRHGLPAQPWRFFELLYDYLLKRDMGFVLLASKNGQYLASGVFLYTQETITYKYAASIEGQDLRSNHLLTWVAIQWACEHGFRRLDFGRSDIDNLGLRTFKSRWGAEESALLYTHLPETPAAQQSSSLFPYLQTVIRKCPTWVSSLIGQTLYKHFG